MRYGRGLYARIVLLLALTVCAAMAVFVMASRLGHPSDLEWMTGSVLDHMERVREGKPLYVTASARWIPLLYPPLYYWLGAALGGGALASRLISIAATLAQAVLVWNAARSLAATRFWAAASALVFVAAFSFVGFWYDLERSDNLFGAIVLLGSVVLLRAETTRGHAIAGVLMGLALLAKQQAVFYLAGAGAGLVLATLMKPQAGARPDEVLARRRHMLGFCIASGATMIALLAVASAGDGAAAYYLLRMPHAHGVVIGLARGVFSRDFGSGFLLVGVTLSVPFLVALAALRRTAARRELIGASILIAGFAGAVASRLHIGGWFNVLVPWTTCASVAIGVLASRVEVRWSRRPNVAILTVLVVLAQLVAWRYNPRNVVPRAASVASEARLLAEVRSLEREGEVMLPARGHITRVRHFHISALADVARVEGHSPEDLVEALRRRAYAAVVDDARYDGFRATDWPPTILEDLDDLRPVLLSAYYVARHIDYGAEPLALVSPATPCWVYRPRRAVLDVDATELRRRQVAEMHLAEKRSKALARGEAEPFAEADIEELARTAPPETDATESP